MSEENIATLRRGYESLNRGDFDRAVAMFHPDAELYPPGEQPPYRGRDSIRSWMEPDAFQDQAFQPLDFTASGNKVLVKQHVRARGAASGMEVEIYSWAVWTLDDDGLVIRVEGYLEHEEAQAREAAGLPK
jgi:ketosteroid isomerase-like protein